MAHYHDLEHIHPPLPELGEEVTLHLETEAKEGLLLYEKDGEIYKKPMEPAKGGLRVRVSVHASPFRYCFLLPSFPGIQVDGPSVHIPSGKPLHHGVGEARIVHGPVQGMGP